MSASLVLPPNVLVLERGWLSSNNTLFLGRSETALLDSGYASHSDQTIMLVEEALGSRPLDLLLNTHLHSDHCGGNSALQIRYPQLRTFVPPGDAAIVRQWDEDALSFRATGQYCARFRFEGLLIPGQGVMLADLPWQVHAAPGHDPHSVILFEPETSTLVSADALWENGFGVVFPELIGEPSFAQVAATLDLIERLAPQTVIPGHGAIFHDCSAALTTARRRLDGLARDPIRHARHALKVLVKFRLLEVQTVDERSWESWIRRTPYLEIIRSRFFPMQTLESLCGEIAHELIEIGAASRGAAYLENR